MKIKIEVTSENRNWLLKVFSVSKVTIWKALTFEKNTILSRKIRKAALEHGGIEMVNIPLCNTIFDEKGKMTQTFRNGAKIVVDKSSGNILCYKQNDVLDHILHDVKISDFEEVQRQMSSL